MASKDKTIQINGQSSEEFKACQSLKDSRWLAEHLGISYEKARTLGRLKQVPHIRIGRLIKYSPDVIEKWISENMFQPKERA